MNLDAEFERRSGGSVKRWHTWPIIGEQTVAAHSWGVARIIIYLYSNEPCVSKLIGAAIDHDITEVRTGDIPAHVKMHHPRFKVMLKEIEEQEESAMDLKWHLSPEEAHMLKVADWCEMLFFSIEQAKLGSKTMDAVDNNILSWFSSKDLSERETDFITSLAQTYKETRYGNETDHA